MGILKMPIDGQLVEGHPIGIDKIILGDQRERTIEINGEASSTTLGDGTILYDRAEPRHRPWFILVYESGRRVIN